MLVLHIVISQQLEVLSSGLYRLLGLEFTFWPGSLQDSWSGPHEYGGLVERGLLDFEYSWKSNTILVRQVLGYPVRPSVNPELPDYRPDLKSISNDVLARDPASFESIPSLISDEECNLLAISDDVEILNKKAMFHDFSFVALDGFELRHFISKLLGLEIADYTSTELPLLVEDCLPAGLAPHALKHCWCVLQERAVGLAYELIDQSFTP